MTVGFDSPLVRPPTCIWGEWNGGYKDAKMESKHNRTMEKLGKSNGRREGMEGKNKGNGLEFRGGVYDGGKVGGTRAWLGRALWGVGRQCGVRLF